jgi:hypothetical protein
MIYALILGAVLVAILIGVAGYMLGRYQAQLVDKIRTLEGQARVEPEPEPEKPVVAGGAYQPPKAVSSISDKKQRAGLVETKTPELLEWENKNELENLATRG